MYKYTDRQTERIKMLVFFTILTVAISVTSDQ